MEDKIFKPLIIASIVLFAVAGILMLCRPYFNRLKFDNEISESTSYCMNNKNINDNYSSNRSDDNQAMYEISKHPWKRIISGDPYGSCVLEVLSFSEKGSGYCQEIYYAGGNKMKSSGFQFSYYINGDNVYCNGSWEYVFKKGKLYDKQKNKYKSGSDLLY